MRSLLFSSLLVSSVFAGLASTVALAGPDAAGPPAVKPADEPEGIDRASIQAGIAKVKPKILTCGDKVKATGTIKVKVTVSPKGKVSAATLAGGDAKLGACVVAVMKTATFKATAAGGSFTYPFVFGSSTASTASTAASPTEPAPPTTVITPKKVKLKDMIQPVKIEKQSLGGDTPADNLAAEDQTPSLAGANAGGVASPPPPPPAATALDRATISAGIAKVKAEISACGTNTKAKGTVKIAVTVAPAGTVTKATVSASPDAALGACVQGVIAKATFAKTNSGGSFSYPFVF